MTKTINIPDIQDKLYQKLKPSGWARVMKSFLLGTEFTVILQQLFNLSMDGKKFTPKLDTIFKAFEQCPYSELHTVIINREPYEYINTANGIAFDSSVSDREHFMIGLIFEAIQRTVYTHDVYKRDLDLSRWSNQGVLLLNASLTVQIDKQNTHHKIWEPFTAFLLDTLSIYNSGLNFVFMGDNVKHLANIVNAKTHFRYLVPHPTTAAQNKGIWDSQNIFPILSRQIKNNYKKDMIW